MNPKHKKKIVKNLIPILGVVVKEFLTGGKTKLGIYILTVATLSLKYWAGMDIDVASAIPSAVPPVLKTALTVGSGVLGIGVGHDLIKKGKNIFNSIKKITKSLSF